MPQGNKILFLLFFIWMTMPVCFGQSTYLQCSGTVNKSSIMGNTSTYPFSTTIELEESSKYIDIQNLFEVAPGIELPLQRVYFGKDKILFSFKKEVSGDFVEMKGEINRFTEDMTVNYTNINPKSADKILTIKTSLNCKVASSRKF